MLAKVCYSESGLTTICGTQTFSIVVINPCLTDSLSIDTSKFDSPALTYNVKDGAKALSWTDSVAISVKGLLPTCGTLTWTVTKTDGTTIDTTVFTGAYTSATKTFSTYTADFAKAVTYNMRVNVSY